MTALMLFI